MNSIRHLEDTALFDSGVALGNPPYPPFFKDTAGEFSFRAPPFSKGGLGGIFGYRSGLPGLLKSPLTPLFQRGGLVIRISPAVSFKGGDWLSGICQQYLAKGEERRICTSVGLRKGKKISPGARALIAGLILTLSCPLALAASSAYIQDAQTLASAKEV